MQHIFKKKRSAEDSLGNLRLEKKYLLERIGECHEIVDCR